MLRQPEVEPGPCTLVCAQQYEEGCEPWVLHRDRLEEREYFFAIGCDFFHRLVRCCVFLRQLVVHLVTLLFASSPSDLILLSSYNSLVADSGPRYAILAEKVFSSYPAAVSPSSITTLVKNGSRRTAFSSTQLRSFFNLDRLPTAACRRTIVAERWILSLAPVKVCSAFNVTMSRSSSDPAKAKVFTFSLRDLFSMHVSANITWTYPGVALFVSSARFIKFARTYLKFATPGSSECINSWIERILRSQTPFWSCSSINNDK